MRFDDHFSSNYRKLMNYNYHNQQGMNVFYFVKRWPRRNESAISQKILSLTQTLINCGHKVSLVSADTSPPQTLKDIQQYPISLVHIAPDKIAHSLAASHTKPQLAIFNQVQMEQMYSIYLYNKWNKCSRLLEINRAQGLEEWRKKHYTHPANLFIHQPGKHLYPQNWTECFNKNQIQSIFRSDYYLCANQFLYYLLTNKGKKKDQCIVTSFGYPVHDFVDQIKNLKVRPYNRRKNFVYVGNLNSEQNIETVTTLISQIWPFIKKQIPDCQLHIFGVGNVKNIKTPKKELQKNGILIKNFMQDLIQLQNYRVLLDPTRTSTGTKGKIIDSWFCHTPVVTTPIGAQGIFLQSIQPKFTAGDIGTNTGFFNERQFTPEEINGKKIGLSYYQKNLISKEIQKFNFGGFCSSNSFADFAKNAVQLYTNEKKWEQSLQISNKIITKNQNETQLQINIKFGFGQLQMASYNARKSKEYEQEWKRYLKSQQLHKKLSQIRK